MVDPLVSYALKVSPALPFCCLNPTTRWLFKCKYLCPEKGGYYWTLLYAVKALRSMKNLAGKWFGENMLTPDTSVLGWVPWTVSEQRSVCRNITVESMPAESEGRSRTGHGEERNNNATQQRLQLWKWVGPFRVVPNRVRRAWPLYPPTDWSLDVGCPLVGGRNLVEASPFIVKNSCEPSASSILSSWRGARQSRMGCLGGAPQHPQWHFNLALNRQLPSRARRAKPSKWHLSKLRELKKFSM